MLLHAILISMFLLQVLRRTSSGSIQSQSDESDSEPSPPTLRRGRRQAIFDSKVTKASFMSKGVRVKKKAQIGKSFIVAAVVFLLSTFVVLI